MIDIRIRELLVVIFLTSKRSYAASILLTANYHKWTLRVDDSEGSSLLPDIATIVMLW